MLTGSTTCRCPSAFAPVAAHPAGRLALYSGWLCARRIRRVIAPNFSARRALFACPVSAQVLRTASLTETALAFGIGSIVPSVRAGGGYNLIDECDTVLIARNYLNDFAD